MSSFMNGTKPAPISAPERTNRYGPHRLMSSNMMDIIHFIKFIILYLIHSQDFNNYWAYFYLTKREVTNCKVGLSLLRS